MNVTSPAPYTPIPGATAYTASRFAMHGFNEALRLDLHSTEIGVTEIIPFHVDDTGYTDRNENVRERTPDSAWFIRSVAVETVADAIVAGVRKNRRRVILPIELRFTLFFARLAPGIMNWLNVKTGWQPSRPWSTEEDLD